MFRSERTDNADNLQVTPSSRLLWSLFLLGTTSTLILFPTLPLILPFLSSSPNLLLLVLGGMTLSLSCATAYLQSAVFALASLWGSQEVLAVMSGQGGIAVIVSATQVLLALIFSFGPSAPAEGLPNEPDEDVATQSTLAGAGLWAIASLGAAGCYFALKTLERHREYEKVMAPFETRLADGAVGEGEHLTREVLRKNWVLEFSVAWVFVITLVRRPYLIASRDLA